jgi:uncharacterized FlaG/YvyC family protein
MPGEISVITGMVLGAPSSPVAASSHRSGSQRPSPQVESAVSGILAPPPVGGKETIPNTSAENKAQLAFHQERAQKALMTHNASFSFERDSDDGRTYLLVKNKATGEEIYRIPKSYLRNAALHSRQPHGVDVHI